MSASLVGSEMCIRDRLLGQGETPGPRPRGRELGGAGERGEGGRKSSRTCLLYTSDAADDM
eukprot:1372957-Alexandrium_andersonii.AAC.1